MTCQCDCTHTGLANRRSFIAGLACTAILPMAASAQLAGAPTAGDVTFMRMAIYSGANSFKAPSTKGMNSLPPPCPASSRMWSRLVVHRRDNCQAVANGPLIS